ncbi:hypothetical protein F5B18DRAFT_648841 [Nemania serpens]|nr:hypothetical protein F5B18DRAFT_648841 [Nemania serpens]
MLALWTILATESINPKEERALADGKLHYNVIDVQVGPSAKITGSIVFYLLPLGNPGTHEAWHSHIRLHYTYSLKDQEAFVQRKVALAIKQEPTHLRVGESYNATTISVQWNGARGVDKIMSKAVQKMIDDLSGKVVLKKLAVIDGTRFKYQFCTDVTVGPTEVAAALSAALDKTMEDPDKSHPQPRMPTVRVARPSRPELS